MNPHEHLAQWRRDCPECSGLSMCDTHREAARTLRRKGEDAYREFVDRQNSHPLTGMVEGYADSMGAEMAAGLVTTDDSENEDTE